MTTWPIDLPEVPLLSGFKDQLPNLLIRSQVDVGPAKVRRRYTSGVRPMAMSFLLTSDQVDTFESFYLTDLGGGALPFDFTHPRTGSTISLRFTGEPPESVPVSDTLYRMTFTLEALP